MSRKFTKIISEKQLAEKIVQAAKKHPDFDLKHVIDQFKEINEKRLPDPNKDPIKFIQLCDYYIGQTIHSLTQDISKDLAKVQFDTENISFEQNKKQKTGFYTLPNKLAVFGVSAGGDWEFPVYFIIYYDGKKLRAYIPTDGNLWNTTTNQAYGNDDQADNKNIKKRWNIDVPDGYQLDIDFDFKKIEQDIMGRITQ